MLWLVEEEKRYTTIVIIYGTTTKLWLVEEEKRYTTSYASTNDTHSCGLLKKRRDIQRTSAAPRTTLVVAC